MVLSLAQTIETGTCSKGSLEVVQDCTCLLHFEASTNLLRCTYRGRVQIQCLTYCLSHRFQSQLLSLSFLYSKWPNMVNTTLIVALAFGAVFGAVLIWLTLFYIQRYIQQGCLELSHWFHLVAPWQLEAQTCWDEGNRSWDGHAMPRSRSSRRAKSRGRREYAKSWRRYQDQHRESFRIKDTEAKWPGHRGGKKARPMLPMSEPVQNQWPTQQFYPSLGWHGQAPEPMRIATHQPVVYPQMAEDAAHLPPSFATPAMTPQQLPRPQKTTVMPEANYRSPRYQQPFIETSAEKTKNSQPEKPPVKPKRFDRSERQVNEVDYIHICDEYPRIVQEGLKKVATATSSSSSCSSDTSDTTQEVPRAAIPRATRRFADTVPYHLLGNPQISTRAWDAPTSFPRQWMGHSVGGRTANAQA